MVRLGLGILAVADAEHGQLRARRAAGYKSLAGHRNLAGDTGLKGLRDRRSLEKIVLRRHCTSH